MLCTMAKKLSTSGRTDASIPQWLLDAMYEDKVALGSGERNHSGAQAVFCAGIMLYLALPVEARRDLAVLAREKDSDRAKRLADAHWTLRAVRAIARLGAGKIEQLEAWAEAEGGETPNHNGGTERHGQLGPAARDRKRKGA